MNLASPIPLKAGIYLNRVQESWAKKGPQKLEGIFLKGLFGTFQAMGMACALSYCLFVPPFGALPDCNTGVNVSGIHKGP